ncbi:hypothetical protein QYM36_006370, partial [Artemia franciscana]
IFGSCYIYHHQFEIDHSSHYVRHQIKEYEYLKKVEKGVGKSVEKVEKEVEKCRQKSP